MNVAPKLPPLMQAEALVDVLVDRDVLAVTGDGQLTVRSEFEAAVERRRERDRAEPEAPDDPYVEVPRLELDHRSDDPDTYSRALYRSIREWLPDLTTERTYQVFLVLDQLYRGVARSEGAPASFAPIRGDQLGFVIDLFPRAIVYIWLEDCPPCDTVREDFDRLFPEQPEDLGLFAVYGPEYEDLLRERYDVVGGPTTLFVEDGRVSTRLHKAPSLDVLENEIGILRE